MVGFTAILFTGIGALLALAFSLWKYFSVQKQPEGTPEMARISRSISEGANAYLKRQYGGVGLFMAVVFLLMAFLAVGGMLTWFTPFAFITGAFFSGLSGFIGMKTATMANCRTANAASKSLNGGLRVAFDAGSVMGFTVVGLGLLDLTLWYFLLNNVFHLELNEITANMLTFGMGASSMALFARVGGGIFTKAADVGADLVGKVEAGIPEDDPRNPAVIADNVGDNVGDVAGMGADLYESYVGSIISTAALGVAAGYGENGVALPLLLAALGVVASIAGTFFVKTKESASQKNLLKALRTGTYISAGLVLLIALIAVRLLLPSHSGIYWSILSGLIAGVLIGAITEYYTSDSYKPTQHLADSSQTGASTIVINGLSLGMLSTLGPVIVVCAAVLIAFYCARGADGNFYQGLYGIGISAVGMLSTLGITLATDAYGPIADNAGGIAEMTGLPPEVRERTDALDSLGNTTAATGKGFAIGSAALTALALMVSYINKVETISAASQSTFVFNLSLTNPSVLVGLFIGGVLPFLFAALTMSAVGKAAQAIVMEVRRQFHEITGLLEGQAEPDYRTCVDMCTRSAQKLMIAPTLIAMIIPVLVGLILGPDAVVALLAGNTVTGFVLAIMMSNAGGAWDNAKKYIEAGHLGGKGSDNHKAAVVGDTVGDPFKDTSGPSINILIKLCSTVSIVFAGLTVAIHIL
ncbi:MAG: sodium-translocating pyrophosphatase [Lachnospiraceae bacterium]|nr:sodium-translocating pyrophosphatase [Lachnospiraceae bacterium]